MDASGLRSHFCSFSILVAVTLLAGSSTEAQTWSEVISETVVTAVGSEQPAEEGTDQAERSGDLPFDEPQTTPESELKDPEPVEDPLYQPQPPNNSCQLDSKTDESEHGSEGSEDIKMPRECDLSEKFDSLPLYARCLLANGTILNIATNNKKGGPQQEVCYCGSYAVTNTETRRLEVQTVYIDPSKEACTYGKDKQNTRRPFVVTGASRGEVLAATFQQYADCLESYSIRLNSRTPYSSMQQYDGSPRFRFGDCGGGRFMQAFRVLGSVCHYQTIEKETGRTSAPGFSCQDFGKCASKCFKAFGLPALAHFDFFCKDSSGNFGVGHRIVLFPFVGRNYGEDHVATVYCLYEAQLAEVIGCYDGDLTGDTLREAQANLISAYYLRRLPHWPYKRCTADNLHYELSRLDDPTSPTCCRCVKGSHFSEREEKIVFGGSWEVQKVCPVACKNLGTGWSYDEPARCVLDTHTSEAKSESD